MDMLNVKETERPKLLPEIVIRPQTPQEELDYLLFVLRGIPFYKENKYSIELPDHPLFQNLADLSPNFDGTDMDEVKRVFETQVYDPSFFTTGTEALESERGRISQALPTFVDFNNEWGFRLYPKYDVTLTRYGPGGMYLEDSGRIIMMTRADGTFKRKHPSHTPVHEMVHLGIEGNIVKRFRLKHWEKERVVDRICSQKFGSFLPDYWMRPQGDVRIDPYVTEQSLHDLPSAISRYVDAFPRE